MSAVIRSSSSVAVFRRVASLSIRLPVPPAPPPGPNTTIAAEGGEYSITGGDQTSIARQLIASAGTASYAITGRTVDLVKSALSTLFASSGEYEISGGAVDLTASVTATFSCNMTAGNYSGAIFGYENPADTAIGGGFGGFGSIDGEPVPGATLLGFFSFTGVSYIFFDGDIASDLAGLNLWVDGVEYAIGEEPGSWLYVPDLDITAAIWSEGAGPSFADGVVYFIEIK